MKIAVIGSRQFTNYATFTNKLYDLLATIDQPHFLRSEAGGTFAMLERYCTEMGYPLTTYYIGRTGDNAKATAINSHIIQSCDVLLAFYDGESAGVRGAIELAERLGKKVETVIVRAKQEC